MPAASCPECDGHGSVECPRCYGSGNSVYYTKDDERKEREEKNCDECGGSGRVECGACGGSGGQNVARDLGFDSEEQYRDNMF